MRGFEGLDVVRFPCRTRVSDGTPFAGYVPLHNYASTWPEKPTEQEVRKSMKDAYITSSLYPTAKAVGLLEDGIPNAPLIHTA